MSLCLGEPAAGWKTSAAMSFVSPAKVTNPPPSAPETSEPAKGTSDVRII
jgi:hypothetical protein